LSEARRFFPQRPEDPCNSDQCHFSYAVTIRGDGTVQYDGSGALQGHHTRTVLPDDVIALANEFLNARFLTALDSYEACCGSLRRRGNTVELGGMAGGADAPHVTLVLKIGTLTKTPLTKPTTARSQSGSLMIPDENIRTIAIYLIHRVAGDGPVSSERFLSGPYIAMTVFHILYRGLYRKHRTTREPDECDAESCCSIRSCGRIDNCDPRGGRSLRIDYCRQRV